MLVSVCYRSDWSDGGVTVLIGQMMVTCHTYVSSQNCVFNSKRFAKIYEKIWMYHIKKLKHQHHCLTAVNCDGHSRTPGSVQEPELRPGAREKSVSPAWPVTPAKNANIYIFFSYRVIYVITLSYYVKTFGSITNSRPPMAFRKNNLKLRLV